MTKIYIVINFRSYSEYDFMHAFSTEDKAIEYAKKHGLNDHDEIIHVLSGDFDSEEELVVIAHNRISPLEDYQRSTAK